MSNLNIDEEVLDVEINKHLLAIGEFNCGVDHPLNDFICSFAYEYALNNYGKTYLLFYEKDILVYYTLKAGSITMAMEKETVTLPLIEITCFAVAYDFQGKGLGTKVFNENILPKIEVVSSNIAIYGIMVFVLPDDEKAIGFYKSLGFIKAGDDVQKNINHFNEDCELYILKL